MGRYNKWLLALFLLTLVELAVLAGFFDRFEMSIYDSWFRLRGAQAPGSEIVIVAIDDPSIEQLGPLAWPRSNHAKLLEKLKEAKVVGFDLIFDVATNPQEDQAMARAIAQHGRVVLASKFSFEEDSGGEQVQVFTGLLEELLAGAAGLGFVNMPTDPDGVVRRVTAVDINTFDVPFPSLGLAVALAGADLDPTGLNITGDGLAVGKKIIPLDDFNRALPDFWGPQGTFKTYSYADVLDKLPASTFKDKIVLVGATSPAVKDYFSTPYTTSNLVLSGNLPTPGVEIHAATVKSFLAGRWYRQFSPWVNVLFLVLIAGLSAVVVTGRGPWLGLAGILGVTCLSAALVFGLWWLGRWWLNLAAPLTLIFLNYAVMTSADFVQAELGRRRTKSVLRRYVSADVAEELMKDPDHLTLGGHRKLVTVLFCDIRGFTSYSEHKDPQEVVKRLNEYLTAMTGVIFRHGGTLDKYLGDGLMAIFGAPVDYPDHIQRAIMSALEIQKEIAKLNQAWQFRGELPLQVGVGINSGSVLVGNVGSLERMDYTVIGEDVNLASRIEGLTKTFGTPVLVSQRSVELLEEKDQFPWDLQYLGLAEVKGFTAALGVYAVVERS